MTERHVTQEELTAAEEFAIQTALIGLSIMPHMLEEIKQRDDRISKEVVARYEKENP